MKSYITLDLTKTEDIEKAIYLTNNGYYILIMGLNLITLTN
jgi:hypothetical protein